MAGKDSLKKYRAKRDFARTAEPSYAKASAGQASYADASATLKSKKSKQPIFVIQQHDASHMHYDFRIEVGGVLKSWAIPKGPSFDPSVKRLAVATEDHPMDYAKFEGIIPQGEYGGGTVMVWDYGTYENIKEVAGKLMPMKECVRKGQIELFLHGEKLQGAFVLVRTKFRGKDQWLFIKMHDEFASKRKNPVTTQKKSVLTHRTLRQIAADAKEE